ncbi:MAG TPA: hypothetical protein PKA05_05355 [Roseiflexaceae bacterium]|nr:hypothetical protein [Roseiflexaceae bacterium]HMP39788.1 hypothetical protein [Roseiflexaceae bacterium]
MQQRRNIRLTLLVLGVIVTLFTIAGMALLPRTNTPQLAPSTSRIEYRVDGDAEVTVSFLNDLGFTEERTLAPPWVYGFRARPGRELTLTVVPTSAQGVASCEILINGQLVQQAAGSTTTPAACLFIIP